MSRLIWGEPDGIPEGSNFDLMAELTINGVRDTTLEGGTYVMSLREAGNSTAANILTDTVSSSNDSSRPFYTVKWSIEDSISNGWAVSGLDSALTAVTYNGDIRGTLADGRVLYWGVALKMRQVLD